MGMGWTVEDLSKPQVMIESTFGDSHPGSAHLLSLANSAAEGVAQAGGKGARYFATDICDGMAQGHDGINYSLASRDVICSLCEIHANATPLTPGYLSPAAINPYPALLMAIGRINIPSVMVTGGVMQAGPNLLTLEQLGKYSAMYQRGEITEEELTYYKHNACPSCGACSFMGTASTMQIMAEALGLMLPGHCVDARHAPRFAASRRARRAAGRELAKIGLRPRDFVTEESFENAILVHAAISGSTNSLLHLPAIAHEFGLTIDETTFDRLHRKRPLPAEYPPGR